MFNYKDVANSKCILSLSAIYLLIRPKIKFCLFAIAYLPTIFPPTQKILLGFLDEFFFLNESALCSAAKGDLVI